jgi:hypothetical protein
MGKSEVANAALEAEKALHQTGPPPVLKRLVALLLASVRSDTPA